MARKKKQRKKPRRRSVQSLERRIEELQKREKKLRKQLRTAKKRVRKTRKEKREVQKKKVAKRKPKKELKSRGRDIRQKPRLGLARDYRSGFKPFLERVDKRTRGKHRSYAIVRVVLLDYADSPTRDLSIFLGEKTTKELSQLTNRQILSRAPGRWGRLGSDSEVLFIAKLKGGRLRGTRKKPDKVRSRIAKTNKRARASIKAANVRRRRGGLPFHPSTR